MDITILGYKISLEVIILIGVVYLILVGHTVGSCCHYNNIMEGLTTMTKNIKNLLMSYIKWDRKCIWEVCDKLSCAEQPATHLFKNRKYNVLLLEES